MSTLMPRKAMDAVSYKIRETNTGEASTMLTLNGVKTSLRDKKETLFEEISTLNKKEDQKDLDKKDCLALIAAATQKKGDTYSTSLAGTIDVESKLDHRYNIGSKIKKWKLSMACMICIISLQWLPQTLIVGKNTNMTNTNIIAGTKIKFNTPLTVRDGTDVTRNNMSDLVAI
jgi:hypothetical protein